MALYYLALSFLVAHELDAVTHEEWRLLFVLRDLPSANAAQAFVALHVPLLFVILWLSHHDREAVRRWTRRAVSGFLVVHAGLHFALSGEPLYDFHGVLSRTLIFSAGLLGAADVLVQLRQTRSTSTA